MGCISWRRSESEREDIGKKGLESPPFAEKRPIFRGDAAIEACGYGSQRPSHGLAVYGPEVV